MNKLLILISLMLFSIVENDCNITQEELDAEYTALGTYEIQVDEFCEL